MPARKTKKRSPRGRRNHSLRRLLLTSVALAAVGSLVGGLVLWMYARHVEHVVVEKFSGRRWALPSRIYSDSFLLYPGLDLKASGFRDRLHRLNYRKTGEGDLRKGDYRESAGHLELFLRDFPYPGKKLTEGLVRITLEGDRVARMESAASGEELFSLQLEPEIITGLYDSVWEERQIIPLEEVPPLLVRAIVTIEDQRFFEHSGIDPIGIVRAALANLRQRRVVQGGSTLTQQLMKNFFLSEERTFRRKLQEALMALIVERRYSKDEILENYLNEIYLGQSGVQGIFGVWEASQFYFARPPQELSVAEMALLAALIRAPNRYSPYRNPELAKERRDLVLRLLAESGGITVQQYSAAVTEPLRTVNPKPRRNAAPYFVDFLREELNRHYPPDTLTSEGLRVFTSFDVQLQQVAEQAIRTGLQRLEKLHPKLAAEAGQPLQAALLAIQPQNGEIKAMVGGRSYAESQFNRTVQARRQPGSVFKPFVYLAAFERTAASGEPLDAMTRLEDAPFAWEYDSKVWTPANYKDQYLGSVTVRTALELSLNAATARLAHRIGLDPIRDLTRRMGIAGPLPPYPSIVLGALETSPFEVAQAYAVFANGGLRATPRAIKRVLGENGLPIESRPVQIERVVSPESAYLVTRLLQGAIDRGTGRGAREMGFTRPAAGKTGTTNEERDAWFAGFTPDLLTVVWVGFDHDRPVRLTGAQAALPIWTDFMKAATAAYPPSSFLPPPGVSVVDIDPESGALASPDCPRRTEEAFRRGSEPTQLCPLHGGPRLHWPWSSDRAEWPAPIG